MVTLPETQWHAIPAQEALDDLETDRSGLDATDRSARLDRYGRNKIESAEATSPVKILLHQFTSPLIYILLVAFVITVAIDHYADAIVIAAVLVINATIGFIQEYRAENAMAALASLVSPRARVFVNGEITEIDSAELVPGDVLRLESGDIVPADVRLLETVHLNLDNAILTGESGPVPRGTEPISPDAPVGDRSNMAYMGTTVASGRGLGLVVATGTSSQIGQIAGTMRETRRAPTPLQMRMRRFGHIVSVAILAVGLLVFLLGVTQGIPIADIFLLAVAMAVSAIPEGLPVVMTVALAVSVRRMAGRNAVIRRLPAVETLGSCSVIVSDKTGTMTENRMSVRRMWTAGDTYEVTGGADPERGEIRVDDRAVDAQAVPPLLETLLAGMLANEARVRRQADGTAQPVGDPTETALLVASMKADLDQQEALERFPRTDQRPFEPDLRYAASVHEMEDGPVTYIKGAPERVIEMCESVRTPTGVEPIDATRVLEEAEAMAGEGLRVIGMAKGSGNRIASSDPDGLTFLGLAGLIDPPREGVPEAIESCRSAGIRVIMVTGDHASTARAIGRQVGLESTSVVTGADMAEMSDDELRTRLRETEIFARIDPTQKHRIVTMLQAAGEIVAVTGDGVNDAPALKAAHIGAAMGITGTDVAKEASEMVLTDDNFATIYAAVEEGRTVFANLRKATSFLVATGVGLVLAIVAAFLLAILGVLPRDELALFPLLLLPAQALWLNVVNNGIQDVALAFEPPEPDQFTRPPYDPDAGLLSRLLWERTIIVGILLAILALFIFSWELRGGASLGYAQTAALTMMVISMAMFVGSCRSETESIFERSPFSNPLLLVGTLTAVSVHLVIIHLGPTQTLLGVEPIGVETWLMILIVAPSVLLVTELHKFLRR